MKNILDKTIHGEPLRKIANIPNALSTLRLGVGVYASILCATGGVSPAAGSAMAIACSTDWIDGYIARKYSLQTKFGEKLDPAVDASCFVGGMGALLYSLDGVGFGLCGVFVLTQGAYSADMIHLGKRLQDTYNGTRWVPTTYLGKAKTAVVMASMTILMGGDTLLQSIIATLNPGIDISTLGDIATWDKNLQHAGLAGVGIGWLASLVCWRDYNRKAHAILDTESPT